MVVCQAVRATTSSVKPSWSLRSETKSNESLVAWWQGRKNCNLCGQVARDRRVLLVCLAANRLEPSSVRDPAAGFSLGCARDLGGHTGGPALRPALVQYRGLARGAR